MTCPGHEPRVHAVDLRWVEVDPTRHPYDPAGVADLIRPRVPHGPPAPNTPNPYDWLEHVTRDLCARFGPWACGWRWARADGGPVTAWCCPSHSQADRDETTIRIVTALGEWRAWLESLERTFADLAPAPRADDLAVLAAFERAAAELMTVVLERTLAEDAWYSHAQQVLAWYLERALVPDPGPLVEAAVNGRFRSWIAPDAATQAAVARDLGHEAATRATTRDDDLQPHRGGRST